MTLHDELTEAQETIARQADEIGCLRELVLELARQADSSLQGRQSTLSRAPSGADDADRGDPISDWSADFAPDVLAPLDPILPLGDLTPEWAWGGSTGRGVKVAVVDSGIHGRHPAIAGRVAGHVAISVGPDGAVLDEAPHDDLNGHGTACAGIIRSFAPDCELYSVRVLGEDLSGSGAALTAALRWAIDNGIQICNLSLGTTRAELYAPLHELADEAYFRGMALVTSANNLPVRSFPAAFASAISVTAIQSPDPYCFLYNPRPPIELGAPGIGVRVAWPKRRWIYESGNSFAAPHITGIVTQILGKHPGLTVFQLKTVLHALAANMPRRAE